MIQPLEKRCSFCNSTDFDKLVLPENQSHVITQVDNWTSARVSSAGSTLINSSLNSHL